MDSGKRVLMLLSNPFRPDPRVHKEATALVSSGYEVTIMCWDREMAHPPKEKCEGIDIIRLGPKSAFSDPTKFLLTLPIFWLKTFLMSMKQDLNLIHAHDLDTLPVALFIARMKSKPLIYDSHEIYSHMVAEVAPGVMARVARVVERWLVRKPQAVVCVNDRFEEILQSWGAKSVTVVMGCPSKPDASPDMVRNIKERTSPDGKPIVLYIGVLEPHRNLLELVAGFASGKCPGARLLIGGFGSIATRLRETKGKRIKHIGPVRPSDMAAYTLASDILVAVYDPAFGNNRDSVPNKLFEAMSAGRPIVVAKGTWTGKTVEANGCGLTATYGSDEVFQAIDLLITDRAKYEECATGGLDAFEREYNWPNMRKRLLNLYNRLTTTED